MYIGHALKDCLSQRRDAIYEGLRDRRMAWSLIHRLVAHWRTRVALHPTVESRLHAVRAHQRPLQGEPAPKTELEKVETLTLKALS